MASPSVRSSTTSLVSTPNTSHTVSMPATVSAGDTLLCFFSVGDYPEVAWPSGWTAVVNCEGIENYITTLSVAWKKAVGTEGGGTIIVTTSGGPDGGSQRSAHIVYAIQDAPDPTISPPEGISTFDAGTHPNTPNLVPSGGSQDYLVFSGTGVVITHVHSYPAGYGNQLTAITSGGSGGFHQMVAACAKAVTGTAEDPGAFTLHTPYVYWAGATVAVGPMVPAEPEPEPSTVITGIGPFLEFYDQGLADWVDISNYVRSWSIDWGAFGPIDQQRARTATFILDNRDRRFEPAYAASPYYLEMTVGAYIYCGLNVTSGGTTVSYPIFYGIAEAWNPSYSGQGTGNPICTLKACDPTKPLVSDLSSVTLESATSDLMLSDLFDSIEWGGNFTEDFETGVSTLQEYELAQESIWATAQKIVQSEGGWFYWQPQVEAVTARFLSRTWLAIQSGGETVYYLDDEGTFGQYTHIVLGTDDDRTYTRAIMQREGGKEQNYENVGLSQAIGERTYQESGLLLATDNEVHDRAAHFVQTSVASLHELYATTITAKITVGSDATTHMANVIGLTQPLAAINIIHNPPVGTQLEFNCRVVAGKISQAQPLAPVEITGHLVDADAIGGDAWILEDAIMGVLGTTTVLGW